VARIGGGIVIDVGLAIEVLPQLLAALVVTIEATVLGMAFAIPAGLAWELLRRSGSAWPARVAQAAVEFLRSTPLLVQLYFLFYALPGIGVTLSPLTAGVLGLGLHYSAYTAEIYRAGIDGVPRGQWDAARALNMSRAQIYRHVVLPQAVPPMIPDLGNRLIAMFKDTPLLSAITVVEMLQRAKILGAEHFRYFEPLTLVGLLFLAISLASTVLVRRLEGRLSVAR
jgi:polar amino acid transport system permease protein